MFYAKIIADSITERGHRLTSFEASYPRIILAEVNTHRMLSRNSPSSRAIPARRLREQVERNPFMPVCWPKNEPGMQAQSYLDRDDLERAKGDWLAARNDAVFRHQHFEKDGVHKQITNRVIEPWMWTRSLLSATDWVNFFRLRVDWQAQPEFQVLAYLMLKAYLDSRPIVKKYGEWHTPYGDREMPKGIAEVFRAEITTGRAARVSYQNQNGEYSVADDIKLCDRVIQSKHWSPTEHAAQAVDSDDYFGNFKGWRQFRKEFQNESGQDQLDLRELLKRYEETVVPTIKQYLTDFTC